MLNYALFPKQCWPVYSGMSSHVASQEAAIGRIATSKQNPKTTNYKVARPNLLLPGSV